MPDFLWRGEPHPQPNSETRRALARTIEPTALHIADLAVASFTSEDGRFKPSPYTQSPDVELDYSLPYPQNPLAQKFIVSVDLSKRHGKPDPTTVSSLVLTTNKCKYSTTPNGIKQGCLTRNEIIYSPESSDVPGTWGVAFSEYTSNDSSSQPKDIKSFSTGESSNGTQAINSARYAIDWTERDLAAALSTK
jgi:hypothetical protein